MGENAFIDMNLSLRFAYKPETGSHTFKNCKCLNVFDFLSFAEGLLMRQMFSSQAGIL